MPFLLVPSLVVVPVHFSFLVLVPFSFLVLVLLLFLVPVALLGSILPVPLAVVLFLFVHYNTEFIKRTQIIKTENNVCCFNKKLMS